MSGSDDDNLSAARRLRELFKGRFDQETALKLLTELGGELQAVDFLMNESEEVVQQFLRKSPSYLRSLIADAQRIDDALEHGIEFSIRQFACGQCSRSWWKKVPIRKEVSKCWRCKMKFEPIPKENEWGWGKFVCNCGNEFHGFGEMYVTTSNCYQCGMAVLVNEILPPRRRIGQRKSRTPHSCNGENCYNRSYAYANQGIYMGSSGNRNSNYNCNFSQNVFTTGPTVSFQASANGGAPTAGNRRNTQGHSQSRSNGSGPGASTTVARGSRAPGAYNPASQPICCHPKSIKPGNKTLRTVSKRHTSTGSSVTTFLSQGSLDIRSEAVPRIPPTIHE